jgi:beta-glucuronidase
MKIIAGFIFLLIICINTFADTVSLNNEWRFKFAGIVDSNIQYANDSIWLKSMQIVNVPHSYNLNEELFREKIGFAWYIKDIQLKNLVEDKDYILKFDGVVLRARVFIDGVEAGKCVFPYIPFEINLTSLIKEKKKIRVAVQVNNQLLKNTIPDYHCNGWRVYGGMIRDVKLLVLPKVRLNNIEIRTKYQKENNFTIDFSCKTVGPAPDSIKFSIIESGGRIVKKYNVLGQRTEVQLVADNVHPWTPEDPFLYDFKFCSYRNGCKSDSIIFKRGFAQLYSQKNRLFLNGTEIFLRGIGRHDVLGDSTGPLLSRNDRLKDLLAIKNAGANMLRIAHFPQHNDIYELCDSIGLLVMDEIPTWKTSPEYLASSQGFQHAQEYMDRIIENHGNHTCIVIWCIGNELLSIKGSIVDYIEKMSNWVRLRDNSRLVTYTSYFYQFDRAYSYTDIISINEYFGWYLGSVDMINGLLTRINADYPDKPVIISEFGSSAGLGIHNDNAKMKNTFTSIFEKDFSEEYQVLFQKAQIETIWKNYTLCSGAISWCYNDFMEYRDKPSPEQLTKGMNCMGLVTYDRKPKKAYYEVKELFTKIKNEMLVK